MHLQNDTCAQGGILSQASFLSGLESLRDLYAAVGHRYHSFQQFVESVQDPEDKEKIRKLVELTSELSRAIPETEKLFCEMLGRQEPIKLPGRPLSLASRHREATKIDLEKVVIIPKISKIEYFRRQNHLSFKEAVECLSEENKDISALLTAHSDLEKAKESLLQFFRPEQIKDLSELKNVSDASLVIALGGDDHFCSVAQQVNGVTPVLAVKADKQSVGALLAYEISDLQKIVKELDSAQYVYQAWTKLKVSVNGTELPSAISTVFIGDKHSQYTSRTKTKVIDTNGDTQLDLGQQRSSGLLLYTGTGSTGWAQSAGLYLYPQGHSFRPDARYAEFLVREPNVDLKQDAKESGALKGKFFQNNHFILHEGEKIVIQSLNKDSGIINADSVCIAFRRGSEAVIEIDPEPLWVIVPRNKNMKNNLDWIYKNFSSPAEGKVTRTEKDRSYPERFPVANRTDWHSEFKGYASEHFEHPKLAGASYAEPANIPKEEFLKRIEKGELKSFVGQIELDPESGLPLNPIGRTGISGRGVLGKFGPNFAVDPVVIYKNQSDGSYHLLVIERKDGGWALPGGMVDKGESVTAALFRELEEETGAKREELEPYLVSNWGLDIYADDRRSTDNAWIETSARLILTSSDVVDKLNLKAGDDAASYRWLEINQENVESLYAAHSYIVTEAMKYIVENTKS